MASWLAALRSALRRGPALGGAASLAMDRPRGSAGLGLPCSPWSEEARHFLAGGLAGCAAKTMVAPFERVRIAAQVALSGEVRARSSLGIGADIVRREGLRGLWRSNGVAVLRTFPAKAVVFGGNDLYARALGRLESGTCP